MFRVYNTTKNILVLSDLRVEIEGNKTLDLDKVAKVRDIQRSKDLQHAIHSRRLKVLQQDHIAKKTESPVTVIETTVMNDSLSEDQIANVVRRVLNENQPIKQESPDLSDAFEKGMSKLIEQVTGQISILAKNNNSGQPVVEESIIKGDVLANLSQKALEKVTSEIESSNSKNTKTVILKSDKNLRDLADEL